jgi:uncharacterized membrane protein YphA (DoxX/SURF4 family)
MNRDESKKHRKNFAIGLAVIGGFIALASFSSTYSINLESFQDWGPKAARALALFASIGIEVMFCLVIYAIGYALVGFWEKALGVAGLAFLLFTMSANYVIHRQVVKGIPLSEWQQDYYDWTGALSLFGVLLLIVLFGAVSYEARERRQQREIDSLVSRRALEWKKELIESREFTLALNPHKQQVFDEVKERLRLPPVPTGPQPIRGFNVENASDDPKGQSR